MRPYKVILNGKNTRKFWGSRSAFRKFASIDLGTDDLLIFFLHGATLACRNGAIEKEYNHRTVFIYDQSSLKILQTITNKTEWTLFITDKEQSEGDTTYEARLFTHGKN